MRFFLLQENTNKYRATVMRNLIYAQIIFLLLCAGFFREFPFLSSIHYLTDVVTLILFMGVIRERKTLVQMSEKYVLFSMMIYMGICVLSVLVNGGKFALILWASRNTYRFFVFYCACICFLKIEDILKFFNFIVKLQYINCILVILEYAYFTIWPERQTGLKQDLIGGIFGIQTGCNSSLNIFLCMVFTIGIINILQAGILKKKWILLCMSTILCATFAELKVFYLEMGLIFVGCVVILFKRKKMKLIIKLAIILLAAGAIGLQLMYNIYPYSRGVFTNYQHYENGISRGSYRIGRMHAFERINELFFNDSLKYNLLGLGFGNCEYSKSNIFVSDFYRLYGEYNYRWFTHQMLFLETGLLGVVSFASVFVVVGIQAVVRLMKKKEYKNLTLFAGIMAGIFLVNIFYNCNIRTDSAYINYLCLAIVPILNKQKEEMTYERHIGISNYTST